MFRFPATMLALVVLLLVAACDEAVEERSPAVEQTSPAPPSSSIASSTSTPEYRVGPPCLERAAEQPPMPDDPQAELKGIVVERGTATAIPGITVAIPDTGDQAVTNELGHFYFRNLASAAEPEVRRAVLVADARFASWEVRRLPVSQNDSRMLVIQLSATEPFLDEWQTPDEINKFGLRPFTPLNSQPTPVWEMFREVPCGTPTGEGSQ